MDDDDNNFSNIIKSIKENKEINKLNTNKCKYFNK